MSPSKNNFIHPCKLILVMCLLGFIIGCSESNSEKMLNPTVITPKKTPYQSFIKALQEKGLTLKVEKYTAQDVDDSRLKQIASDVLLQYKEVIGEEARLSGWEKELLKEVEREYAIEKRNFDKKKAKNIPYGLLIQALNDKNPYVRELAACALEKMRPGNPQSRKQKYCLTENGSLSSQAVAKRDSKALLLRRLRKINRVN
ncbi:MAG: hypothetical protein GY757_12750 [bacterium]|nr:hypothetical protein [bacterium]